MVWFLFSAGLVVTYAAAVHFWRKWVRPWRDVDHVIHEVINGRTPRTFLVDGNRSAQRIAVALEDVFVRQRHLATRVEEDQLNIRTILGAMRDGLAVVDGKGRLRLMNAVSRHLFGITDDGLGRNVIETFRDPLVAEMVTRTLQTGASTSHSINVRGGGSGGDRRLAVTSLAIQQEDGGTHGAIVLFQDVTQLQQLEQVRKDFVSNVSHELRTPLSIFRGYLETLIDEPDLARAERERILRVLEKHSTRLHSLVDDLLSLARLEAPDPGLNFVSLSLDGLLQNIVKDWEKKVSAKELRLVHISDADLPPVSADEARLEEIIYNLLDNAVKYSSAGGQVTLRASRVDEHNVAISVTDEGTGIAAADLPRIFERFYRADKARSREMGGTGLGLSIVKHIVQLHGGSVEAESQLGRGTAVHVILPKDR